MSSKLKQKTKGKLKVLKDKIGVSCHNDKEMPLFSFAFTTDNKSYNFEFWNNNLRDELNTRKHLDKLLKELSVNTWLDLSKRNKYQHGGFETLHYDQINFTPSNVNLPKDENIFSFRFGSGDACRMLGYRKNGCQVVYILGYDFDFSSYNHGS